ncbi:hypothetical protein [Acidithiobacillus thiooxidans]|uniref:Uncharacterized protein n=1 Tax=Acidithiobacillus thiooxidans TaxID=930 RepID=A0A1C2IHU9_ACITH|nr:hypothetical protein [Acidithiobacillus thiooxidans]OCX75542.1 hypothetical protein A6M23_01995 [Acidithiobacillus thiooxidans]OCX78193.1 hypothetical protein A6P08_19960 [Acidithiobacillus thiooxidans]
MSNRKRITENQNLIHDLAVAQASFLLANLAPAVSASIDRSLPIEAQRDQYYADLPGLTGRVIGVMNDLAADEQAMEDIMGMGLKIAEKRAMAET